MNIISMVFRGWFLRMVTTNGKHFCVEKEYGEMGDDCKVIRGKCEQWTCSTKNSHPAVGIIWHEDFPWCRQQLHFHPYCSQLREEQWWLPSQGYFASCPDIPFLFPGFLHISWFPIPWSPISWFLGTEKTFGWWRIRISLSLLSWFLSRPRSSFVPATSSVHTLDSKSTPFL